MWPFKKIKKTKKETRYVGFLPFEASSPYHSPYVIRLAIYEVIKDGELVAVYAQRKWGKNYFNVDVWVNDGILVE